MLNNYPPGFNHHELDGDYENIDLPEEMREIKCVLTIKAGPEEEIVYSATFSSLEDIEESGLRKAQGAIDDWQQHELKLYIRGLEDEAEENY